MASLLIPILLLLLSLVLYMDEVTDDEPDTLRTAVYILAIVFACINLNLFDVVG